MFTMQHPRSLASLRRHLHSSLSLVPLPKMKIVFFLSFPSDASLRFSRQKHFYGVRLSVSRPARNLKGQGVPFILDNQLSPVGCGRPCQQLHFHRHSLQDPLNTPAPPQRQNRDIIGGRNRISSGKARKIKVPLFPATYCKYSHKVSWCDV